MKEELYKKIKNADISDEDWYEEILDSNTDKYAKGYISRYISELTNSYSSTDEAFRRRLLTVLDYNIWNN